MKKFWMILAVVAQLASPVFAQEAEKVPSSINLDLISYLYASDDASVKNTQLAIGAGSLATGLTTLALTRSALRASAKSEQAAISNFQQRLVNNKGKLLAGSAVLGLASVYFMARGLESTQRQEKIAKLKRDKASTIAAAKHILSPKAFKQWFDQFSRIESPDDLVAFLLRWTSDKDEADTKARINADKGMFIKLMADNNFLTSEEDREEVANEAARKVEFLRVSERALEESDQAAFNRKIQNHIDGWKRLMTDVPKQWDEKSGSRVHAQAAPVAAPAKNVHAEVDEVTSTRPQVQPEE